MARLVLKSLLGWYSFIVMTATRRSQAMHDLLTRSTVQIRDPAKANPHHYIAERADFQSPDMPSKLRRSGVICVYLLLVFVGTLAAIDALPRACIDDGNCSAVERLLKIAVALIWLAVSAACVGLGWHGKLLGARRGT